MAIEERKTKAERREEARQQRKAEEAAAQAQAKKKNVTTGIGVIVLIVLVGLGVYFVADNSGLTGGGAEANQTITREAALAAYEGAQCETLVDNQPLEDRTHHEIAAAPPADVMYGASPVRPTTSGPHYSTYSGPIGGIPREPIDERSLTHNLEHGSLIVWFDAEAVDGDTQNAIESYMQDRQDMGFQSNAGGNVFVSPYEGITSGKPIAIRLWGVAVDCESWDPLVADRLLIDYWGTHGDAPENFLSEYPAEALGYADEDAEDEVSEPTTEGTEPEDVGSEADELLTESEEPTEADASDAEEPAEDASASDEG